jgi:hypothetical protein
MGIGVNTPTVDEVVSGRAPFSDVPHGQLMEVIRRICMHIRVSLLGLLAFEFDFLKAGLCKS